IVSQQAEFTANQQILATDIRHLTDSHLRMEKTLGTTVDLLARITETQLRMVEAQAQADLKIAELATAQKRTDEALAEGSERLNSLILVVERYFSNGRGNQ